MNSLKNVCVKHITKVEQPSKNMTVNVADTAPRGQSLARILSIFLDTSPRGGPLEKVLTAKLTKKVTRKKPLKNV